MINVKREYLNAILTSICAVLFIMIDNYKHDPVGGMLATLFICVPLRHWIRYLRAYVDQKVSELEQRQGRHDV